MKLKTILSVFAAVGCASTEPESEDGSSTESALTASGNFLLATCGRSGGDQDASKLDVSHAMKLVARRNSKGKIDRTFTVEGTPIPGPAGGDLVFKKMPFEIVDDGRNLSFLGYQDAEVECNLDGPCNGPANEYRVFGGRGSATNGVGEKIVGGVVVEFVDRAASGESTAILAVQDNVGKPILSRTYAACSLSNRSLLKSLPGAL
jgi:hypothetical protein